MPAVFPEPPLLRFSRVKVLSIRYNSSCSLGTRMELVMENIEIIKAKLVEQKPRLAERFKVKEIGIFGSLARGEQAEASDIDILVEFSEPIGFFLFIDLEDYLSEILAAKVDLVSKKALKPHIGKNILRELVKV